MRIGVLGPVALAVDGQQVPLRSLMQRRLLAILACHANEIVSRDRLIDALWEAPPESAADNLRQYVFQLRRLIGEAERIERGRGGYRLTLDDAESDAARFRRTVVESDRAVADGDDGRADELYAAALAEWRGPKAYPEVCEVPVVLPEAQCLQEARLLAIEQWYDVRLRLGRHDELTPELAALVAEEPLRERLRTQWALALYRAGRQGEALEACRQGRRVLASELGMEPGQALLDIEQAIIRQDRSLDLAVSGDRTAGLGALSPAELPADPGTFAGRESEIKRLCELFGGRSARESVPVAVIAGVGGVGKSALALHAAHRVAAGYPDGQLYVNLHGSTPDVEPLTAQAAVASLMRSLGIPDTAIPVEVDEAAARFRSATSQQRLLIVLDNALDAAQVRLSLPASPTCGVIVTSRRSLASLDGIETLPLDVLAEDEAIALLRDLVGEERSAAEPQAVAEIVRDCGRLPLALRMAGARAAARPDMQLHALAGRLADERGRLGQLEIDDRGVRASFAVSYRSLADDAAQVFRRMSLLDCADLGTPAVAALADRDVDDTADVLEKLLEARLVESHSPGRYRMHDLMRLFARERAAEDETVSKGADALRRGLHHYLATARSATRTIAPNGAWRTEHGPRVRGSLGRDFRDAASASAWIDAESDNLARLTRQCLRRPEVDQQLTVAIAAAAHAPLHARGLWEPLLRIAESAVSAAHRIDEPVFIGLAYDTMCHAQTALGRSMDVGASAREALLAYRRAGSRRGESVQLLRGANAFSDAGELGEAIRDARHAVEIVQETGDREGEGVAHGTLGLLYQRRGDLEMAIAHYSEAIQAGDESGDALGVQVSLANLAEAHRLAARPGTAVDHFEMALERTDVSAGRGGYADAEIYWGLGSAHRDLGVLDSAKGYWADSARLLHKLNLIDADERRRIETSDVPDTPEIIRRNQ